jgi:hypothetical protein
MKRARWRRLQACPRMACHCTAEIAANRSLPAASAFRAGRERCDPGVESRILFDLAGDCSGIVDVCQLNDASRAWVRANVLRGCVSRGRFNSVTRLFVPDSR